MTFKFCFIFLFISFPFRWRSHCLIFISYISIVRCFFLCFLFFDCLSPIITRAARFFYNSSHSFENSVFLMWFSLLLHQTNFLYDFSVPPPYEPPPPPSSKFNSSQEINWKGFSLRKTHSRQKDLVWYEKIRIFECCVLKNILWLQLPRLISYAKKRRKILCVKEEKSVFAKTDITKTDYSHH